MDIRTNEIVEEKDIPPAEKQFFVKLEPIEFQQLQGLTPEERDTWVVKHIPTTEMLARYLQDRKCKKYIVVSARNGAYATPSGVALLLRHLRSDDRLDVIQEVQKIALFIDYESPRKRD